MRTGPTNMYLRDLITEMKIKSQKENVPLLKRLAQELERSTRSRRIVNISRINRYTEDGETIVVPGKVLGTGLLNHKVTVAAFDFSKGAKELIENAKGKTLSLHDFIRQDFKGQKVRIIG